jgi:hypothetical protein
LASEVAKEKRLVEARGLRSTFLWLAEPHPLKTLLNARKQLSQWIDFIGVAEREGFEMLI